MANPVLVPKKNKELRMCIDYTGVNKCCPKDPFALPRIDQVVDSTAGSELLCFLDAYSGYHQIKMRESDQLKTSFTTPYGTFCYITMPFGLKNAGATCQRCMQNCLHEQIGRNVHVYVDDIAVMSKKKAYLLHNLKREISEYIAKCDVCSLVKGEHQKPAGLLQPLKVPAWKWIQLG